MKSKIDSEHEVQKLERTKVPDATTLKQKILKVSAETPQLTDRYSTGKSSHQGKVFGFISARFAFSSPVTMMIGLAVVGLALILLAPGNQVSMNEIVANDSQALSLSQTQLVEDDLAWRELLLMQDELAFMSFSEI